jgi:hypothetical protein
MTRTTIPVALMLISTAACATASSSGLTPAEIESLQTREFEATKGATLGAVVTVSQGLGYAIESVDKDTGAITAGGPRIDTGNSWTDMVERLS